MKITIKLSSMSQDLLLEIDDKNKTAFLNGEKILIDTVDFSSRLKIIVASWKEKMIDYQVLDGQQYFVTIEENGKVKKYEGRNAYPENFRDFVELLNDYKII